MAEVKCVTSNMPLEKRKTLAWGGLRLIKVYRLVSLFANSG